MSLQFDPAYNWGNLRDALDDSQPTTNIELYLHTIARCMLTIAESEELKMEVLHAQLDNQFAEEEEEEEISGVEGDEEEII